MVKVKIIGADSLILKGKAGQKFKTKVIGAYSLKFAPKRFIPTGIYPLDFQLILPTPIFISPSDMSELYTVAEGNQTYLNLFNFPFDVLLYTSPNLIRPQPTNSPTTYASLFPPLRIGNATRNREFAKWGKVKFQVGSETREFEITDIPFSVDGADREDEALGQIGIIEIYPYGFGNEKVVFKYKVNFEVYSNAPRWLHETLTIAPAGSSNQQWFNHIEAYYLTYFLGSGYPLNISPSNLFDFGTHTVDYEQTRSVQKYLIIKVKNIGKNGRLRKGINFTWRFHTYVKHWASLKMSGDLGNYFWEATSTDSSQYPVWWESITADIKFDANLGIPTKAPVGYGTLIINPAGGQAEIVLKRTSTNKITVSSGVFAKKYFFTVYNSPNIFPSYPFAFRYNSDEGIFSHTFLGPVKLDYVLKIDFNPANANQVFIQYNPFTSSHPDDDPFSTENTVVPIYYYHNGSINPSWFSRKTDLSSPNNIGWWVSNNTVYKSTVDKTFGYHVGVNEDSTSRNEFILIWDENNKELIFHYKNRYQSNDPNHWRIRQGHLTFPFGDAFPLPLWIDILPDKIQIDVYYDPDEDRFIYTYYIMSIGILLLSRESNNSLKIRRYMKASLYEHDGEKNWKIREWDLDNGFTFLGTIYSHHSTNPKWIILGDATLGGKIYTIQEDFTFFGNRTLANWNAFMDYNGVEATDMKEGDDIVHPYTIYYYHNLSSDSILNMSTFQGLNNGYYIFFKTSPKLKGIGFRGNVYDNTRRIYHYICGTNPANNYGIVSGGTQISSTVSETYAYLYSWRPGFDPSTSNFSPDPNYLSTNYWEDLNNVNNYSKGF